MTRTRNTVGGQTVDKSLPPRVIARRKAAIAKGETIDETPAVSIIEPRKPKQAPFSRTKWERNIANAQAKPIGDLGVPDSNVCRVVRSRVNSMCEELGSTPLTISGEAMEMLVALFLEFYIKHGSELAHIATVNCHMNPTESDLAASRYNYMRHRGIVAAPNQTSFDQQASLLPSRACRTLASHSKDIAAYLLENDCITMDDYETAVSKNHKNAKSRANNASRARRARKRAENKNTRQEEKEEDENLSDDDD